MGRRLVSFESTSWFSPFVDIAVNGMAAMFVFLAVYVAVVTPGPRLPPLAIWTGLPRGTWYRPYDTVVVAYGGAGGYVYGLVDPQSLEKWNLKLDPATGRVYGTPRPASTNDRLAGQEIRFDVVVQDALENQVTARLDLSVAPGEVPFDPNEDPLRFAIAPPGNLPEAFIGRAYPPFAIGMLGGIEPYRFSATDLPAGMTLLADGRLTGTPEESSVPPQQPWLDYTIRVAVVDMQNALLPPEAVLAPRPSGVFRLRVHRISPIAVQPILPLAQQGRPYEGALLARGGRGKLRWRIELENLPPEVSAGLPASLVLDESGSIRGTVGGIAAGNGIESFTFRATVDDEDPLTLAVTRDFTIVVATPMRFESLP